MEVQEAHRPNDEKHVNGHLCKNIIFALNGDKQESHMHLYYLIPATFSQASKSRKEIFLSKIYIRSSYIKQNGTIKERCLKKLRPPKSKIILKKKRHRSWVLTT